MTTSKFKVGDRVVCRYLSGHVIEVDAVGLDGTIDGFFVGSKERLHQDDREESWFRHAPEAAGGPEDCPEGIVTFVDEVGGRVWMRQRPGTTQIQMGRIGQMGRGAFGHPEDTSDEHDVGAVIWVSTGVDLSRGDPW